MEAQPAGPSAPDAGAVHGEVLVVSERVVLAPAAGKFRPAEDPVSDDPSAGVLIEAALIEQEQVIGFIDGAGHSTPVRTAFAGLFMGLLAHAGERVREGQPVAWLRLAG